MSSPLRPGYRGATACLVIVAFAEEPRRREALRQAVQAAQRAVELAQPRYAAGMVDFRDMLDAERSLLSFQGQLTQTEGTVTSMLVRLIRRSGAAGRPSPPEILADLWGRRRETQ